MAWPESDDFESGTANQEVLPGSSPVITGINYNLDWSPGDFEVVYTDDEAHSGTKSISYLPGWGTELQIPFDGLASTADEDFSCWIYVKYGVPSGLPYVDYGYVYQMRGADIGDTREYYNWYMAGVMATWGDPGQTGWIIEFEDGWEPGAEGATQVSFESPEGWVKLSATYGADGSLSLTVSDGNGTVYGTASKPAGFTGSMTPPQAFAFHSIYVGDFGDGRVFLDDVNADVPPDPDPDPEPEPEAEVPYSWVGWGADHDRYFHQGVDRGILYPHGKGPVAWNGITGVNENSDSSPSVLYRDGIIFYSSVDPGDYSGSLTTFWYPDEFAECAGIPAVTSGFHVDNQRPKPFDLSYRSLIGSGTTGDMFGYQIHLIYNATAQIGSRTRKTLTDDGTEIDELSFDLVCTPVQLPGFRPSAHYIIDTRNLSAERLAELEEILYGDGVTSGALPKPSVLHDIIKFGDQIIITQIGPNKYKIEGSSSNVESLGGGKWALNNINAVDNGDTITLSDTP